MESNKTLSLFPRRKYTTKILRKEGNVKNSGVGDSVIDGKSSNNSSSNFKPPIVRPYNKRKQKPVNTTTVSSSEISIVPSSVITVTAASNNRVSEDNSSCNFQLFRCQLVKDQRILVSDQTVKTYELQPIYAQPNVRSLDGVITTPTSSYTVPIVSTSEYIGGANNMDNANFATLAINDGVNNEIITEIIDQDSFENCVANKFNEQNDAEFAFGRSVAIMLKKIENVSARLTVQAKIYQVLSAELKVNM